MDSPVEGSEEEFEMEPIALSSPPPQGFDDTLNKDDMGKKSQVLNKVAVKLRNTLATIRENCVAIKRFVEDQWLQPYGCAGNPGITRAYQVWPGNNVCLYSLVLCTFLTNYK